MHASLLHALDHHVAVRGGAVFTRHLSAGGVEELTFASFQQRAAKVARLLRRAKCAPGDVVLIFLPTSPDVLASFVGAMMVGAVPALMPLPSAKQHPAIYWRSHRALLRRIKPRILLTDRATAEQMNEHNLHRGHRRILAIEDVSPRPAEVPRAAAAAEDVALLQHSSGTTSLKKGVMLSHGAILRQVAAYAERLGATADDPIASWLPLYHDMGLIACSMMPLVLGQTVTILDPFAWVARPATLLDAAERYGARFVWMPNFAFEHLARTVPEGWAGDLSGVKAFINCSEPCKPETFDRFRERFAGRGLRGDALQVCYAMAETVFAVSQTRLGAPPRTIAVDAAALRDTRTVKEATSEGEALHLLSTGPVLPGLTLAIRDPDTRALLGERTVGEITIEGAFLFDGYHNAPEITAERLEDGSYFTRDLGFMADGELFVLGRKDDLIIVNGRNLHAHEVEALAADIAGIKPGRAVAFGVFSEANSSEELVIVAERAGPDADAAEIAQALRERVFDETNIDVKDVLIVDANWLVKTTSGKISREKNRDKYLRARPAAPVEIGADATADDESFAEIVQVIARLFKVPVASIARGTVASEVRGWDSLAHSTLILEIEKTLGIAFADDEMFSFANVGALADRAAELRARGLPAASRIILDDDEVSIVRIGEAGDGPDIVIFAGAAINFTGQTMMDFASTLSDTRANGLRRIFVTDKKQRWFTDSMDRIAATINDVSTGPKIVLGNSMGGYGALSIGPKLDNVLSILAFVPQFRPLKRMAEKLGRTGEEWYVRPARDIPTCIVFGEIGDEASKAWVSKVFDDPDRQAVLTVPNCGHNVVGYLNGKRLLSEVLLTSLDPARMIGQARDVVAKVRPSAAALSRLVLRTPPMKKRRSLPHLIKRRAEEGLPPLTPEEMNVGAVPKKVRRKKRPEKAPDTPPSTEPASVSHASPVTPATTASVADDEIFAEVRQVVARLFKVPAASISRGTVASEVRGWDSLAHSTLILEIEKTLGIAFADDEMFSFANVGALADRAAELRARGLPAASRIILDDDEVSIVRIGEAGDGPDIVIFAGAAAKFGGQTMMDFASTLNGTRAGGLRKIFVTDKKKHWFTDAPDRIAATINSVSPGPKVVLGNSMGGYGALSVGPKLEQVVSILAFVPQHSPPKKLAAALGRAGEGWFLRAAPDIPTCVVFGEVDDDQGKAWLGSAFASGDRHALVTVPNCGHNVIGYLNKQGLLAEVLLTSLDPERMIAEAGAVVTRIEPSAKELGRFVLTRKPAKKRRTLPPLIARRAAEGLPPLTEAEIEGVPRRRGQAARPAGSARKPR